jgi:antitoxin ParD1/3/4
MNVSLPDPMREWVQSRVDSGKYASASDYMRDLIRQDQDAEKDPRWVAYVDAALEEGLADIEAGRIDELEEVRAALTARFGIDWQKK